jgi:hypothetical protein
VGGFNGLNANGNGNNSQAVMVPNENAAGRLGMSGVAAIMAGAVGVFAFVLL